MEVRLTLDDDVFEAIRKEIGDEVRYEITLEIADTLEEFIRKLRGDPSPVYPKPLPKPEVKLEPKAKTPPKKKMGGNFGIPWNKGLKGVEYFAELDRRGTTFQVPHIPEGLEVSDYATRLGTGGDHNYRRLRCDVCGRVFLRGQGLASHMRFIHVKNDKLDGVQIALRADANRRAGNFLAHPDQIENEKTGT